MSKSSNSRARDFYFVAECAMRFLHPRYPTAGWGLVFNTLAWLAEVSRREISNPIPAARHKIVCLASCYL